MLFSSAACWILTCPYLNSMQRIPAYLLEGVGFFNCMLDTYLDTYLPIPQQHAANTHLLDHEKVPSSQGACVQIDFSHFARFILNAIGHCIES